ncbi:uncharacterized protein SETTUDRAFT_169496 [Exserohilum turcica Et28A]|uniref:Uncharacterized protein n=1 Tax=Exserohilum turcicum (strain 28A) TaxID=671987 RepID=R0KCI1_EXST2|nr:uncharacterized protein SETTUDRAFT_169496 [Exserohilum turcica Et28A]EOA85917.1 hypothetical protein SETTUDRAFT_169496 [Exserohilum turcica Et28A]
MRDREEYHSDAEPHQTWPLLATPQTAARKPIFGHHDPLAREQSCKMRAVHPHYTPHQSIRSHPRRGTRASDHSRESANRSYHHCDSAGS